MEALSKDPQSAAPPSSSSSPQILHHQSHSYSSYPPHHHQYPPPPPHPFTLSTHASPYYQQHHQQSPFTYSGGSVPQHSYPNGHYHQPRLQLMQHVTSPSAGGNISASWPDVPPTTATTTTIPHIEQMDTTTFGSSNSKSRTPSPLVGEITEVTDAASALETLAHAASFQLSSSSSYSPTLPSMLSSAGPLKKRRKVLISSGSETEEMMKDTATMEEGARGSKNDICSSISTRFPNILHSLLTKGNSLSTETDHNDDMSTSAKAATVKEDDNNNIISSSGMEWLHHGKSFRILRYDVLCDEILPKEFVGLCSAIFPTRTNTKKEVNKEVDSTIEKNVDKSDSRDDNHFPEDDNDKEESERYTDEEWIESFLWHLRSYGYEEIMIGREKGSFRHEVSRYSISL